MSITSNENHHTKEQTKITEEFAAEVSKRYGLADYEIRWITRCPFIQFKKDGNIIFETGVWEQGYSLSKCIGPRYYQNILTAAKNKEDVFKEIDKILEISTIKKIIQMSIFDI
jgi:hypothetical protein